MPRFRAIQAGLFAALATAAIVTGGYAAVTQLNLNRSHAVGDVVDELNGVKVYYNGGVSHSSGRNLGRDGYNLGIKYQCVEFIKRYYFERFGHEMPDAFGNAMDFFDATLRDGDLNAKRALRQFRNGSASSPQPDDILVLGPWVFNPYGHVAIVAAVEKTSIEIVQQNPGPFTASPETIGLVRSADGWTIDNDRVLGWLRLPDR
jgi:CHAP domain